jgi:hypothetical protein
MNRDSVPEFASLFTQFLRILQSAVVGQPRKSIWLMPSGLIIGEEAAKVNPMRLRTLCGWLMQTEGKNHFSGK